jgi:Zn2+/Cd2+-exporting ATPase
MNVKQTDFKAGPVERSDDKSVAFIVEGMDCADEIRQIESRLGHLAGIDRLKFDLVRRRLVVEGSVAAGDIRSALNEIGMQARSEDEQAKPMTFCERHGRLIASITSGVLLMAGGLLMIAGSRRILQVLVLAASAISGAWFIAPKGFRAARGGILDMNFLMTIAAIGAAAIGEWGEGASAMFLFSVAQMLEVYSMDRARSAIKALMDLSPPEAIVKRAGSEVTVPVDRVNIGETILVKPGQRIPLDGNVLSGQSAVNQSPITGESMPVEKAPGSEVFAGSINAQGLLEILVTKHVEDTTLARIIHAVEEAQASRAPSQNFVDRFSRIYTPAVVGAAVLVFLLPPLAGIGNWSEWFVRALTMLVVACPCALVISTPVSIVSGLAAAARSGVLIKGGIHLENAGAITAIAFDKTGTLTLGRPAVADIYPLDHLSQNEILSIAANLEKGSEHPLAQAILSEARERSVPVLEVNDFEAIVGRGIRARIEGQVYYVGNERLAHERGICTPQSEEELRRFEREGKTAILLSSDTAPLGVIAIADQIRPNARAAMDAMRANGVQRLLMLTGDNKETARTVAANLGLDDYRAELLPADKVKVVQELEAEGERVAFVGDGVNDAPALASATLGIAMGAAGTDAVLETSDIALMADNLLHLPFAIAVSRKTSAIIRQNIVFSIAVKAVFLALALAGWATLWMAVAADMGASLIVIANGLRTLHSKPQLTALGLLAISGTAKF